MPRHSISFTFYKKGFAANAHGKDKTHLQGVNGLVQIQFNKYIQFQKAGK